jgi:hypothetical protein
MHKYETNLASEFYVLATLYRLGADAALSLGNKKAIDITVLHEPGDTTTIDVKGVAGKHDWPADNIAGDVRANHFVVFVSFEGRFDDPKVVPSIWVVPHAEVGRFQKRYDGGRVNVSRSKVTKAGTHFRDNWGLLLRGSAPVSS